MVEEARDKKIIYVIDDDQEILVLMKKRLTNFGMEVETFTSPESFIKRIKERLPDLCFVDLNIGVYTGAGFQLIQAVRKKVSSNIVLIVLSARDSSEDTTQALEIGADDYIVKPIKPAIIESKLKQYLGEGEERRLTSTLVEEEFRPCSFDLGFFLYHLNEDGFIILGQHFIPKQTNVEFSSGILLEIVGEPFSIRAKHNWIHEESGLFATSFSLSDDDKVLKSSFRNWMLNKNRE